MNLLALETSCEQASVALWSSGAIAAVRLDGHLNHSEHILSAIRALLAEAGLSPKRLDAVAFGSGPGAFTGLRLSCGIAQGLALGAGIGVVAVSSLAALAMQGAGKHILAATDARMGEVYYACFERVEDGVSTLVESCCTPPDRLMLPASVDAWSGVGSAFLAHGDILRSTLGKRLSSVSAEAVPRAEEVARLAADQVRKGGACAPEAVALRYVRDKVAYTTAERLARGGKA